MESSMLVPGIDDTRSDDTMTKHSLYKLASPLQSQRQRCPIDSSLQGKLRMSEEFMPHSHMIPTIHKHHSSEASPFLRSSGHHHHHTPMDNDSLTGSRLHSSLEFPSGDHTLSLSESDESAPLESQLISEPNLPYPESGGDNTVLFVNADTSNIRDPSLSTIHEVTSVKVPSPVKVIPHFIQRDSQWRRFSSNFVSPPPPSISAGRTFTKQRSNKVLTAAPNEVHQTSSKVIMGSQERGSESTPHEDTRAVVNSGIRPHEDTGVALDLQERRGNDSRLNPCDDTIKNENNGVEENLEESEHPEKADSLLKSAKMQEKRRKNKGRMVASRYMSQATDSRKQPGVSKLYSSMNTTSNSRSNTRKKPLQPNVSMKPKKPAEIGGFKVPTAIPRSKNNTSLSSRLPSSSQPPTSPLEDLFQTPTLKQQGLMTSTPYQYSAGGRSGPPVHDGSFLTEFVGPMSAIRGPRKNNSMVGKNSDGVKLQGSRGGVDDMEMELLYHRLIQLTYLDVVSAKALKQQETEAKAQLYGLWQTVEDKKEEVSLLAMKLEKEERKLAVDKALDVQLNGLGSVCTKLPLMERHYKEMSSVLDATRHDMTLEGVLRVTEDELEKELVEAEAVLGEISAAIREKIPKVCDFSSSSEVIAGLLDREYQELEKCWEELSKVTRTQTKETSLHFEKRYRMPV